MWLWLNQSYLTYTAPMIQFYTCLSTTFNTSRKSIFMSVARLSHNNFSIGCKRLFSENLLLNSFGSPWVKANDKIDRFRDNGCPLLIGAGLITDRWFEAFLTELVKDSVTPLETQTEHCIPIQIWQNLSLVFLFSNFNPLLYPCLDWFLSPNS